MTSLVTTGVQFPDTTIQTTAAQLPAMVYLSTFTASSSSTIDVEHAFDSTYSTYVVIVSGVYPSNSAASFNLRLKIGGTYQTGSTYTGHLGEISNASSGYLGFGYQGYAEMYLARSCSNDSAKTISQTIYIPNPSNTSEHKGVYGSGISTDTSSSIVTNSIGGKFTNSTSALTGLRFYFSAGTITGGTFRLYGIRAT